VVDDGRLLRQTRGRCGTCLEDVPAALHSRKGSIYLDRDCPTHGRSSQLISRAAADWAELDRYYFTVNADERPQRDYIVRMTERCNLACPICLAKANTEDTPDLDLSGLEKLLSERRGIKIDLMAAEPTLRPDLEDWVRRVKASGNVAALHTNGLKLANADYCHRMKVAGVEEVFLQFDGLDDEANKTLRGRPLLQARQAALKNLRAEGIATSLIVVVGKGINEAQVSETFRYALRPENDHIREVFFLGLRGLGSARYSGSFGEQALMPDEILDLLCAREPGIRRRDVVDFNKLYFAMLSALKVKKCLYVQHYLVLRGGPEGYLPISEVLEMPALGKAADRYAARYAEHPAMAKAGLAAALVKQGLRPAALRHAVDLVALEQLLARGMNLDRVPPKMLLLGFITACDPDNFDAAVAVNCGKGELSADGGFVDSGAVANVERERRFAATARKPGRALASL
jgi:pyruvate-formate lyase-activating enzyme